VHQDPSYEYPASRHEQVGYPYRVWIFSFLAAPFLMITIPIPRDNSLFVSLGTSYLLIVFLQLIISIPTITIYLLMFWFLPSSRLKVGQIKALLALTVIVCLYITARLLSGFALSPLINYYLILFSSVFIILSFACRIKSK
jgi:hypothetical protein